jgi:hypothetical protein
MKIVLTVFPGDRHRVLILTPLCRPDTRQWTSGVVTELIWFWFPK